MGSVGVAAGNVTSRCGAPETCPRIRHLDDDGPAWYLDVEWDAAITSTVAGDAAVLAIVERLNEPKLATLDRRHFTLTRPRHIEALTLLPE